MSNTNNKEYSIETDPLFQQISDEKKSKISEAVEKKIRSLNLDENVEVDNVKVPGQNYALISIVSPQSNQKNNNVCLKIKGVFDKIEDAKKHSEMLHQIDPTFDLYVVDMYSWLLVPPDPELIEQVHVDLKLNEIISGHRESQLKSKMFFEERKRELLDNAEIGNDEKRQSNELEATEKSEKTVQISRQNSPVLNGDNCPNSSPLSTASELLEDISNNSVETPSKSWADKVEEEEVK